MGVNTHLFLPTERGVAAWLIYVQKHSIFWAIAEIDYNVIEPRVLSYYGLICIRFNDEAIAKRGQCRR
jgi:hypothetical protein